MHKRSLLLGVAAAALMALLISPAIAGEIDINDINLNFKPVCGGPVEKINLGDLHVSLSQTGPGAGALRATFTVSPGISGEGSGGTKIWECVSLHFFQFIFHDDDPATVAGKKLPFPQVDTPPHGWDYMYKDTNGTPGIQEDERVPGNVTSPTLTDDANDTLPWYHTMEEEAGAAGSGNEAPNYGLGQFQECVSYSMRDRPGRPPSPGNTSFAAFLVATPKHNCPDDDFCLTTNEFLLLAGFDWIIGEHGVLLSPTSRGAVEANEALMNTGFAGWTAYNGSEGAICCAKVPEPTTWALLLGGLLPASLLHRRVRSQERARI
jgi:hypothetical protein